MREIGFWGYSLLSAASAALLVCYAVYTREQFYPTIQFLVTSKVSLAILGNLVICQVVTLARIAKVVFLGTLRDIEVEILFENTKHALMDTCLALALFRAEVSPSVLAMFGGLLFCKVFHWLSKSRLEHIEQVENVTRWQHTRLLTMMILLFAVDVSLVYTSALHVMTEGRSVMLLFGFENAILAISMLSYLLKYALYAIDVSSETTWHEKGAYVMTVELIQEGLCFAVYATFFVLMFIYYGIPLHVVRDVYLSYISFQTKLASFLRYRRLIANLDERFPDATPEEVAATGHACVICREPMDSGKKIPCNHIFHLDCLRMWLQHQQSCPVCRAEIPSNAPTTRRRRQPPGPAQQQGPQAQPQQPQAELGAGAEPQARVEPEPQAGRVAAAAAAAHPRAAPAVAPHADHPPRPAAAAARRPPSPMPHLQRMYPAADLPIPANPQRVRVATPPVTPGGWRPAVRTPSVRDEQVPAFYKVVAEAGVDVREAPHRYSSIQRHIAKGTAILVTDRVYRGRPWLEVANSGFIPDDETMVQRLAPEEATGSYRAWSASVPSVAADELKEADATRPVQTARHQLQQQHRAAGTPPPRSEILERLYTLEAQLQTMQHVLSELIADELHRTQFQHLEEAADVAPQLEPSLQDDEATEPKLDEPIGQAEAKESVADHADHEEQEQQEQQHMEEDSGESQEEHNGVSGEERGASTPEESTSSPDSPDHIRQLRQRYFARQSSNDSTS